MENKFKGFKVWLNELRNQFTDEMEPGKHYPNDSHPKDKRHYDIKDIYIPLADHIKIVEAGERENKLLRYGMFFDGERLFYNRDKINELSQERFNEVAFIHLTYFIINIPLAIPIDGIKSDSKRHLSLISLILSHFNIIPIVPKYAQSTRNKFYETRVKPQYNGLVSIFAPHPGWSRYFWENYLNDKIKLLKPYGIKLEKKVEFYNGIIMNAYFHEGHVTSTGIKIRTTKRTYDCSIRNLYLEKHEESNKLTLLKGTSPIAKQLSTQKKLMESLN